jgi:hypothetical protein
MGRRDRGVPAGRIDRHKDIKVAFLGDGRHSKDTAILLAESAAFVDDHLKGIFPV